MLQRLRSVLTIAASVVVAFALGTAAVAVASGIDLHKAHEKSLRHAQRVCDRKQWCRSAVVGCKRVSSRSAKCDVFITGNYRRECGWTDRWTASRSNPSHLRLVRRGGYFCTY